MEYREGTLKSAGILTFTYGDNYGQRLQNLAMQEFLKKYFNEVYTIRQIEKTSSIFKRTKHTVKLLLEGRYQALKMRKMHFKRFDDSYIHFYSRAIDVNNITGFPEEKFDFFICGSDQVWSPYSCDVNSTFFLTFTKRDKRIALSPSIASEDIPQEKISKFREYFMGFNYISTREYSGSNLVRKLTGKKVETLIDPTLLFDSDFWSSYEECPSRMCDGQYAVCYFLGDSNQNKKIYEYSGRF